MNTTHAGYVTLAIVLGVVELWLLRAVVIDVQRSFRRKRTQFERLETSIARRLQEAGSLLAIASSRNPREATPHQNLPSEN
jgi:hypothetical protein